VLSIILARVGVFAGGI